MKLKYLFILPFLYAFIIVSAGNLVDNQAIQASVGLKKVVVIDAGHGGIDPGTVSGEINEKDITLDVAKKVSQGLEQKGVAVLLTREGDTNLAEVAVEGKSRQLTSLASRVTLANQNQTLALISIHVNSSNNPSYFGPQTYYRQGAVEGQKLAEKIQEKLIHVRLSKRQAIEGDYYLLNNSNVPAAIVELGFLSNQNERDLLMKESYRQLMADAIVSATLEYLEK